MKTMRKFGAIVLAIMMIAAVGAAFAVNNGDVYTDDSLTTVDATNKKIPLTKSIIMFNINGSDVYEPNISYTYSVAPVTTASLLGTITDDGELNSNVPVTVKVNAGVANGVTFSGTDNTISFSSNNAIVTTQANGVKVEKSTNLTVDLNKFSHAGVYRYLITEANNGAAVTAAGMVRGSDYSSERYLDVYVKNSTTTPGTLELYGAVIFKTDAADNSSTPATTSITTTTGKTTGFEPGVQGETGSDVDYTNDTLADHYTTYDFTVKKTITGGMADKTHNFPFYVNITNTITGAAYTFFDDPGTGTGIKETVASAAIVKGTDNSSSTLALKDGEYVKFVGVPSNQTASTPLTVEVHEYNNSVDFYIASASVTRGTAPTVTMDTTSQMTPSTGHANFTAFDLKSNDIAAQIITIVNNLAEISPTGYVSRFAPYALILIGGVALLVIAMKKRKHTEED